MAIITKVPGFIIDEASSFTFANVTITSNLSARDANLGNTASANFFTGTLTTGAQPNITSIGTLGNLTVTSNATIGNVKTDNLLYSNGSPYVFTTNPAGSNTQIQFNNSGTFGGSANLVFNSSTKTLTVDSITANGFGLSSLQAANVVGTVANANYSINAGTAETAKSVAGANVTGQVGNAGIAGTVYTNAQPNITSVGTLTGLTVSGNVSAGNILTDNLRYANGTLYNFNVTYSNSNVEAYLPTYTGNVTANNITVSNVLTTGSITTSGTSGNITGANVIIANLFQGNANSLSNIPGANVTGQVSNALVSGTVYTNSQPNITSIGTLTSLSVTGVANLGNVSNIKIAGGTNLQILSTDGNGNLSWTSQVSLTGYATETYVGNAIANLVNSAPAVLDTLGELSNALGNDASFSTTITNSLANKLNTNAFSNTANSWAANYLPNYSGNLSSGNANLGNSVTANFFIGNGSLLTGLPASYSNTQVANYLPTHTGNVSANYFIGNGALLTNLPATSAVSIGFDTFTGNGVRTQFTLSSTPLTINHTVVNVDGVIQLKTAYSLSGNVLTFTSAPDNGVPIEVQTFATAGATANVNLWTYTGNGVRTTFAVSSSATANTLLVTENGVLQTPITDYTVSGNNVVFNGAPANNIAIQIREIPTAIGSSAGRLTWNIANANATMSASNGYFVDTTVGAITMTLPSSATLGDTIRINDLAGNFGSNNCTIARNGHKIQGISDDLVSDTPHASFGLVYSNSTYGWKIIEVV